MIIVIIIAAVTAIFGAVILAGKGDGLIAGYNTASPEERGRYHIKRLRFLFGGALLLIAPLCLLMGVFSFSEYSILATTAAIVVLTILAIILANTWARK